MASITPILLANKQKKDGNCPLAIRIIKNRKPTYLYLGHSIQPKDWNKDEKRVRKSHPNYMRLNNLINKRLAEGQEIIIDSEVKGKKLEKKTFQKILQGKQDKSTTFSSLADEHIANLKLMKKFSRVITDTSQIRNFLDFAGDKEITFEQINYDLIKRYFAHLVSLGKKPNSAMNDLVLVRLLFNNAIRKEIVGQQHYPFGKAGFQIKKTSTNKIGLEREELEKIKNLKLKEGSTIWICRAIFLTSFYMAGARLADVVALKWEDIHDGRVYYVMGKNKKAGSIKIVAPFQEILNYFRSIKKKDDIYVFPDLNKIKEDTELTVHNKVRYINKKLNKYLKQIAKLAKIDKPLTMHIARHTFGNLSGDKIPIQMLQKLYRHSHVTTTISYQASFMNKDTDEALDSVIS